MQPTWHGNNTAEKKIKVDRPCQKRQYFSYHSSRTLDIRRQRKEKETWNNMEENHWSWDEEQRRSRGNFWKYQLEELSSDISYRPWWIQILKENGQWFTSRNLYKERGGFSISFAAHSFANFFNKRVVLPPKPSWCITHCIIYFHYGYRLVTSRARRWR